MTSETDKSVDHVAMALAVYDTQEAFRKLATPTNALEAETAWMAACKWREAVYALKDAATLEQRTEAYNAQIAARDVHQKFVEGDGTAYAGASAMVSLFAGYVYVQDVHQMATPSGHMLDKAQFDADERFAKRTYQMKYDTTKPADSAWDAFIQSEVSPGVKVRGTRFDPREPEGAIIIVDSLRFVNIWRALDIRMVHGDAARFVDHIRKLLPHGDDALILLCYLATMVQYKGVKAKWAPFLQGVEGNGKSLIGDYIMRYCLGSRYTHKARADKLDGQFNAVFYGKLFIQVDDIEAKKSVWGTLKTMITDPWMEIEPKGVDKVTREVCMNFIFTANPKDGLKKSANDRRVCPLFCAQQEVADLVRDGMKDSHDSEESAYFKAFFHWLDHEDGLAIVADYLEHFEIDPRYNFAGDCTRAPRTTSTDEALKVGHGLARQRVEELIAADDTPGLKGGWVNWTKFNQLLDADAEGRNIGPGERREMLTQMGYIRHPGLNPGTRSEGQVANKLNDGSKPYLWIKRDASDAALRGTMVNHAYEAAQSNTPRVPPPPPTT